MARGRPPLGANHVDGLEGPAASKDRLRTVLRTIRGEQTIAEACEELGIGESRFHVLRREALQGALDALGPRPAGRPARDDPPEAARIRELEAQVGNLEEEVHCQRTRLEVAVTMPHLLHLRGDPDPDDKKGARQSGPRQRKWRGRRG